MTRTLVIGSGGIKGLLFIGGIKALEDHGVTGFSTYVGCSIGALISLFLNCGFSPSEILNIFLTKHFEDILSMGNWDSIVSGAGFLDKAPLRTHIETILGKKLGMNVSELTFRTLREMSGKELYVITVDTDNFQMKAYGDKFTPDYPVLEGVLASCSVPFVFQGTPVENGFMVDGAVMDPIGLATAFKVIPPESEIYCLFLANRKTTELIVGRSVTEFIKYESPPSRSEATQSGSIINNFLTHGQRIFRCFMESLVENYIIRHIYENLIMGYRHKLHLYPMPNLFVSFTCPPELKAQMYFAGNDVVSEYLQKV